MVWVRRSGVRGVGRWGGRLGSGRGGDWWDCGGREGRKGRPEGRGCVLYVGAEGGEEGRKGEGVYFWRRGGGWGLRWWLKGVMAQLPGLQMQMKQTPVRLGDVFVYATRDSRLVTLPQSGFQPPSPNPELQTKSRQQAALYSTVHAFPTPCSAYLSNIATPSLKQTSFTVHNHLSNGPRCFPR